MRQMCFSSVADREAPLAGQWVERPALSHVYSTVVGNGSKPTMSSAQRWASEACFVEDMPHSCFYNGDPKAASIGRREFEPRLCMLQALRPLAFASRHANTTLHFWGDSLSRQHFISFACHLKSLLVSADISWTTKSVMTCKLPKSKHCWFYLAKLQLMHGLVLFHIESTQPERMLQHIYEQPDRRHIVIANHGAHFYGQGAANKYKKWLAGFAQKWTALEQWARKLELSPAPRLIWRETAPAHFQAFDGDLDRAGIPCGPAESRPTSEQASATAQTPNMQPNWRNAFATPVIKALPGSVRMLYIHDASLSQWDAHVDSTFRFTPGATSSRNNASLHGRARLPIHDCRHWCLPGVPDAWTRILYSMLMAEAQQGAGVHQNVHRHRGREESQREAQEHRS